MSKNRTKFTRLGEHKARDHAGEIHERAAMGEAAALQDLERLNSAADPDALRAKVCEIVLLHLADADVRLGDRGPPRPQGRPSEIYAAALCSWVNEQRRIYEFDSREGRAVEIVRNCACIIAGLDHENVVFRLGVVLGYGLAQKNHLLGREFDDGPALAREAAARIHRAKGGKKRSADTADRNDRIRADFEAAWHQNRSLTPNGWAQKNANLYELSQDRVARILRPRPKADTAQ
jgi:hypothetical protein